MTVGSQPSYGANTSLIDPVTTQQFMDDAFESALNYDATLKKMKEAGTLKSEASGLFFTRNIHVGLPSANERTAAQARTFAPSAEYVVASIPWSNLETTGTITMIDARQNSGPEGKVNLQKKLLKSMSDGLRVGLVTRLLTNNLSSNTVAGWTASATTNSPIAGLPTLFGYGSSAQNYDPSTRTSSGAVGAGDREVKPNTTYFGLATDPTAAISGIDNAQPEAISPVILNTTSTAWTGTATWVANCRKVLDHAISRLTRGEGPDETPDFAIMTRTMHTAVLGSLDSLLRVGLEAGAGVSPNFRVSGEQTKVIPYGPLTLHWSQYLNKEVVYVLNSKKMEFVHFPAKRLLIDPTLGQVSEGRADSMFSIETQYDITQGAHLAVASLMGNLFLEPRYHAMGYAAA